MSEEKVNFGVIGYGAWGSCHANAISKTKDAQLVAIAANSESSCERAKNDFPDTDVVQNYHDLLDRDDIDVFHVVLPSHLHFEVASAVLAAGKHLLLEKPMCLSVEKCNELIQLAEKNSCLLAIGHELRLSSLWGKVKEMIAEGFVGDPQYVLVELSRNPYRQGSGDWRYDINRVGNWILEEPIHFFDFARWYLEGHSEPESVYAVANSRQPDHPELQDNFSATVQFKNGAYAIVTQTLSAFEHHQTVKVTGTKGALWASWSGAMDRTREPTFWLKGFDGETVKEIPIEKMTGELFELEDQAEMMVKAIRDKKPLSCSGYDGRWSVALCLAAQESVESNAPVSLDGFAS